ncbi:MoxR family ATPase [Arachnia propionica]|uniref:MoxR family ATPase n=1 Tax=Arachnia propionica TaxID=1750 RepID=A0A3P1T7T6_9ACTN|nr:MoxR family ATPase [Arachnia propionica]MDO5083251.1 MoxR family ATPase [Arachnia propionica]RRD05469.1 MoxR family ATPase [Arachnia propionica]
MQAAATLTPNELSEFLLNVATVRPVFIWGPPGIGKSALVERFAESVGLACVSLLGSQLAPEDLIGVPQITDGVTRFRPPALIARDEPYCLFLDELNACSQDVQKAFYSLIHDRRIGEYELPEGSVVIGAGNRAQDSAIVKPMSSALMNRMVHVHMRVSASQWLEWAVGAGIHPMVIEYLTQRPDHLWSQPPRHEEPFSTPRSWHMLSDALNGFSDDAPAHMVEAISSGCLTPQHAAQFRAFAKLADDRHLLDAILKGDASWPSDPKDRDILYFLAQAFRARLLKTLPAAKNEASGDVQALVHTSKGLLKQLAQISLELAQIVVAEEGGEVLPSWYMVEVVRDLPRLIEKRPDPKQ